MLELCLNRNNILIQKNYYLPTNKLEVVILLLENCSKNAHILMNAYLNFSFIPGKFILALFTSRSVGLHFFFGLLPTKLLTLGKMNTYQKD